MLVLSRKTDEKLVIGSDVIITVLAVRGNSVRIGIEAPQAVAVRRGELPDFGPETLDPVGLQSAETNRELVLH